MSIRPLSNGLQEIAANELNEVSDRIKDDIRQIYEWLDKSPHLNVRRDDQWILNFLRGSKFSVQRAKERLDFYYTIRSLTPELFSNRDPLLPEMQDILKTGFMVPLPLPVGSSGPVAFFVRWSKVDPEKHSYVNLVKMLLMMTDIILNENDNFVVSGVILVEDFEDFHYNYFLQMTPAICKKLLVVVQNAYPIRIKGIHCINVPSFMELIYDIFKPFLSEKLKSRVKFYGKHDFNNLLKTIALSFLPKQYGGEGGCLDKIAAEWKIKVESYRQWFLEDAQYLSDESRRSGKPRTSAEIFGVEGSFRKLNVD